MGAQKLGDVAVGTILKLNEYGKPINYILVQQGSPSADYVGFENVALLFRQDIHSKMYWDTRYNKYAPSIVNTWLSETFPDSLDEDIRAHLMTVKIPYAADNYGKNIQKGENGLSCQAFLPTHTEINLNPPDSTPLGATLSYFKGADNSKRIAKYDNSEDEWWLRATSDYINSEHYHALTVTKTGSYGADAVEVTPHGVRPAVPLSKDLLVLDDGTVTTDQPPTAPGSIEVSGVVSGGEVTITLTAATDPDGTVESYIYERQVDGGAWQQVAKANSLTQTDQISEDWGTVAYRACAVDDMGMAGPYVTGETFTVNSGWVTIGGPAEDMGSQPKSFDFDFTVSVSGAPTVDAITVSAALDGEQVYSGTPNAGTQISVPIDTRLLGAGEHAIEVQASKDDYLPASKRYTFTIPAVTIPAGGTGEQAQGPDGRPVFHTTLAQRCIGRDGVDIQAQVDALTARVKTLEG